MSEKSLHEILALFELTSTTPKDAHHLGWLKDWYASAGLGWSTVEDNIKRDTEKPKTVAMLDQMFYRQEKAAEAYDRNTRLVNTYEETKGKVIAATLSHDGCRDGKKDFLEECGWGEDDIPRVNVDCRLSATVQVANWGEGSSIDDEAVEDALGDDFGIDTQSVNLDGFDVEEEYS